MYKKITLTSLFLLLITVLVFKPLSKSLAELYLSKELKADVSIQNYRLFPLNADMFVASLKLGEEEVKNLKTNVKLSETTLLTLSSFEHKKLQSKELSFDYNLSSGAFNAKTDLEIVGFDLLNLQIRGNYKEENLSANIKGVFTKNSEFDFVAKLSNEANVTKVDLDANTFGGDLKVSLFENKLAVIAKELQLKRIFKQLKQEPIAQGEVDVKAILDTTTLQTKLSIYSKEIVAFEQSFKDVKFGIKKLSYDKEDLALTYALSFTQNEKNLHFDGSAQYNKKLKLKVNTEDFGGKVAFVFDDENITLNATNVMTQELLAFLGQKSYLSGEFDLNVKGNLKKLSFDFTAPKLKTSKEEIGREEEVDLSVSGTYTIEKKLLDMDYVVKAPMKKEELRVSGKLSYLKKLTVTGSSSIFDGGVYFKLKDGDILFNAKEIDVLKLLCELEEPLYLGGKMDLELKGKLEDMNIKLSSKKLVPNPKLLGINDNILFKVSANYKPDSVTFWPYLKTAMLELGKGSGIYEIKHKKLTIKQNLHITHKKIDAPLYVEASFKDDVLKARTPSFGGETKIVFKDEKLNATLENLSVKTLDEMFLKENVLKKGELSGKVFYDVKDKSAKTELQLKDAVVSGVDLDAKLGTLMNAVGLNILSLKDELLDDNKTIQTKISHLEFDATLENEKIHLLDSAFSTPKFRIAALGDLKQNGDIEKLDVYLLDKNGCSIIKQKISGTLSKPILENKILTTTDVAVSIPGELIKQPKKLLDFSTQTLDKTATFLLSLTHLSDANVTLTSDVSDGALNILEDTSSIVLRECKVVYDGKVKAIEVKR